MRFTTRFMRDHKKFAVLIVMVLYLNLIVLSMLGYTNASSGIESAASNPQIGYFNTDGNAAGLFYNDSILYVADQGEGLVCINTTDVSAMTKLDSISTPDVAWDVDVAGNYAYVAANTSGLRIINVTDPENLDEVSYLDTPGSAQNIHINGTIAYIADWDGGLRCINITDPENPSELGHLSGVGHANWVDVHDDIAYIAAWDGGLWIVNVSDPENPTELSNYPTSKVVSSISYFNETAFITVGLFFKSFDVNDPENPQILSDEFLWENGDGFSISEDHEIACVANGHYGVEFIDVSNPNDISEIDWFDTEGYAMTTCVVDMNVFIAEWDYGIRVADLSSYITTDPNGNDPTLWERIWNVAKWVLLAIGIFFVVAIAFALLTNSDIDFGDKFILPLKRKIQKRKENRARKQRNKERLDKLNNIVRISDKIEIETVATVLGLTETQFIDFLSMHSKSLGEVKINEGYLIIEENQDIDNFIDNLDAQFNQWSDNQQSDKKV